MSSSAFGRMASLRAVGVVLSLAVGLARPVEAQESGRRASTAANAETSTYTQSGPDGGNQPVTDGGPRDEKDKAGSVDRDKEPQREPYRTPGLLGFYVVLLGVFLLLLHLVDSFQAYRLSRSGCKDLLDKLPGEISPDQALRLKHELFDTKPTGIAGTTRSILAYSLLLVLGISVFHLLAATGDEEALKYADKILTVLAGALSSVIGFYFGSKATKEGAESRKEQQTVKPTRPRGKITSVDPPKAAPGTEVTVQGTGFGDKQGGVRFGQVAADEIKEWDDAHVRVKVPAKCEKGKTNVTVKPAHAREIVGANTLFEIID
jgi:hypothetical protein